MTTSSPHSDSEIPSDPPTLPGLGGSPSSNDDGPVDLPSELNPHALVVSVIPDVPGLQRIFDYGVPAAWHDDGRADALAIGDRVRIVLQGRRVGGWIVAVDVEADDSFALKPLAKWSGRGPSASVIDLAAWTADRWAGTTARVLRSASPPRVVSRIPKPVAIRPLGDRSWADEAFVGAGAVIRLAPSADRWPVVEAALRCGPPLFVSPSVQLADRLAVRLRRNAVPTASLPRDWALAAAGAVVVGGRAAAFGPAPDLGCVVVFDEHDERLQEERTPTWHARDVALERARRAQVPCVLVSPVPTLEALDALPLVTRDRRAEFDGWPTVQVADRREEPPGRLGLFSRALVDELRSGRRVACVLNRTGRARLLACNQCGELVMCTECDGAMVQDSTDSALRCNRGDHERPRVCASCGASKLKNIRMGVTRLREELSVLIDDEPAEVTASGWEGPVDARVVVGTEAVLHVDARFDTVAFCDFDQELLARRQRAAEQSFALLIQASRLVGGRPGGGRLLLQTRLPGHPVIEAAKQGDPTRFSVHERAQREAMRWPPQSAQAAISGAGAAAFVESLPRDGATIVGRESGWLLRSDDHDGLLEVLAAGDRSGGRVRVAVDPLRV